MAHEALNYRSMNIRRDESLEQEADVIMRNNNNAMHNRPMSREEAREIARQRRMVRPPEY